jgi:uncharacterized membrane protein
MNKNKLLLITFCILLPLFLLLLSYKIMFAFTAYTPEQQEWIDYFSDDGLVPGNYTANEVSHMEDVQRVMSSVDIVFFVLLFGLTLILTNYKKNRPKLKKLFKFGGMTTLSVYGLISLLALLSYNALFTLFHKIFFPQGNWTFPVDSLLTATFTYDFFFLITVKIILLTLFLGILFILLGSYLKNDP